MGKATTGKRIAVQSGRTLLAKVENLMKGGAIPKPVWYDAAKRVPPPSLPTWAPRPKEIIFPEDKLMGLYKRMNPEWSYEVLKMHSAARKAGEKTRAHKFVTQWQKYIEEGLSQEDAYQKVESEFYEIEGRIAAERDAEIVKQLRAGSVPELEEAWAEEAPFAEQAVAHHRSLWQARKTRAAEAAELAARPQEAPEPEDPDGDGDGGGDDAAALAAPKGGRGSKKGPKKH